MPLQVCSIDSSFLKLFFWGYISAGAAQWLVVMAVLYITGASLYAGKLRNNAIMFDLVEFCVQLARIPERLAPGYFDIWVMCCVDWIRFELKFSLVSKSSDFPCVCGRCCMCSFLWNKYSFASSIQRW